MTIYDLVQDLVFGGEPISRPHLPSTLEISTASLAVTTSGITAHMRPPFSRLTGHHPWPLFPGGLAALRVLALGEECETVRTIEFALGLAAVPSWRVVGEPEFRRRLRQRDSNVIALEDSDVWCADVPKIVDWGEKISGLCPLSSVARDLRRVPYMSPAELDGFVRTRMRGLS